MISTHDFELEAGVLSVYILVPVRNSLMVGHHHYV